MSTIEDRRNIQEVNFNARKKSRNKYLLATEYDNVSRKRATDIMKGVIKSRAREKKALAKLPKEIQKNFP